MPEAVKVKAKKNSELLRVLRQMAKNKAAMVGLVIFVIEVIVAILAPLIAPYDYSDDGHDELLCHPLAGTSLRL